MIAESDPPPRVSTKVVTISIVALWLCFFVLTSARGLVLGLEYQSEMLLRRSAVVVIGMALTFMLWAILRLVEHWRLGWRMALALVVAVPIALVSAQVNLSLFEDLQERIITEQAEKEGLGVRRDDSGNLVVDVPGMEREEGADENGLFSVPPRWQIVLELAFARYFLLLAWCALYFALLAGERARVAERRSSEFRQAARAAELRSLRYQVNPHFLFNTLNSLSALILTDRKREAEAMVQQIASFYRQSLTDDPTGQVPLAEEFALQDTYLKLEKVRFPRRLQFTFELPEHLADQPVPGMILQPLVENSVKYAVAQATTPVTISVVAREEYGRLVISVSDNGPGDPAEGSGGTGIGLANVRRRLETAYGREAHVLSGPAPGGGYATHIRIPLGKPKEGTG